jgi:hypothetical protein
MAKSITEEDEDESNDYAGLGEEVISGLLWFTFVYRRLKIMRNCVCVLYD